MPPVTWFWADGHPDPPGQRSKSMGTRDFTPAFFLTIFVFLAIATVQFFGGLQQAERGILLYERTCPLSRG